MLNQNDIAILTNFCENKYSLVEQGDDLTERFNSHFEVFSIVTFRDLFLGVPLNLSVNVYYSSAQNMFDMIGSPFNLISMNGNFNEEEFINRVSTLANSIETSKFFCEKIILSKTKIDELENYKIGSIDMNENTFRSLCNLNNKNVDSFLVNVMKTIFILIDTKSIDEILNIIDLFLSLRYSKLYEQVNVNKYAWRFYTFDPLLKTTINAKAIPLKKELMINFKNLFPDFNQNYILTMYWDTQFLYPIMMYIIHSLFSKYLKYKNDTNNKFVRIMKREFKKLAFIDNDEFLHSEDENASKMFSTIYNYSFRTFQIDTTNTDVIKPENKNLVEIMNKSFIDSDIFNNLDNTNELIKLKIKKFNELISGLKKVNNALKEIKLEENINDDTECEDSSTN